MKKYNIKKKRLILLRDIALMMPKMYYVAFPKRYVHIKEDGIMRHRLVNDKKKYPVRHYRRLKKACQQFGFHTGIMAYVKGIEQHQKLKPGSLKSKVLPLLNEKAPLREKGA